jgi:hypothetical protein
MSEPKVLNINTIGSQAAHAMEASGQAVYIGRRTPDGAWPQSKWANTYPVSRHGRDGAIKRFWRAHGRRCGVCQFQQHVAVAGLGRAPAQQILAA